MRRFILVLLLLFPLLNWAQPYSINWDGATSPNPWVEVENIFEATNDKPCQGTHSLRTRVQGIGTPNLSKAVLRSPMLFNANGGEITFTYDYKWLIYNSSPTQPPLPGSAGQIDVTWEWANSVSGPWSPFHTIDVTNHIADINCKNETIKFAPRAGDLYIRLTVANKSATADNYFYLDNINIDQGPAPTCVIPDEIYITNKTPNGFRLNWEDSNGSSAPTYDWEVRTSGLPGSGPVGLVNTNPPATTTGGATPTTNDFENISGLAPGTTYRVYVKINCTSSDSSFWLGIVVTTACLPPTPFTIPSTYEVCGIQDQELEVNSGGVSFWYKDGELVEQETNTYTLENVSESSTYTVYNGFFQPGSLVDIIQVGSGVTSATDVSPFTNTKSQKIQYIYLAEELKALGFDGGAIKAFGFKTGPNGGTLQRNNFTIHMGDTHLEEFSSDNEFVPTSRLTLVKSAGNQLLVASDENMFELDQAFMWDGVSNIVVQITYSDLAATSNPTATTNIFSSFGSSNRTLFVRNNTDNLAQLNLIETGTRSVFRTNGYFDVLEGCFNQPKIVNVNYTPAPTLNLSADIVNNCAGSPLTKLYILTGVSDYDTYEWTTVDPNDPNDPANDPNDPNNPANAILGDENVGWTFNTTMNMTYVLRASNTGGDRCVIEKTISVENNPSPQMLQLLNSYSLCFDDIQELKVDNLVNETPVRHLFNGNINGVTISNTVSGDAISNETALFSEGTGSLKITHAAQTNAIVNLASSVNMNNLKSITVEFDHIAALQAGTINVQDYAYLEYTTDNGATWKPFLPEHYTGSASTTLPKPVGNTSLQAMFFTKTSYTDWVSFQQATIPTNSAWKSEKFTVPAADFTGAGTFQVRFRMGADGNTQFAGWYIDNVRITPISNYQVTWTPIANLYYDQNATVPYDGLINTGTLYLKGTSNSLNVPYKVEIENQYGCTVEKNFTVSIGLKEAPVVNNITSCGPVNVANTNFGKNPNGVLTYYSSQTSSTPITQITNSGIYYVEQEISGCKSARVPFTVVINPPATVPVAPANQAFCGSATVSNLTFNSISGLNIQWYTTQVGGTPLASTTPINNGIYYGEFTNGSCTSSARVAVNVTVGVTPSAISLSNVYICGTSTISSIAVTSSPGATVNWYQNVNDVTPLANSTVLTTGTYYIAQKIGNCESSRSAVVVSTVQNLTMPTANTTQTFCGNATVGSLMASPTTVGANVYWYGFSTSDTPLSNTTPLVTGTYYVGQSVGDCDSPKRAVSVKILSVNAPVINPITICGDATVSSLPLSSGTGISYKVFDNAFATTEMGQNDIITTGTYYISKIDNGCESAKATVYITVNARPNAPTGNINQTFPNYAEVKDLKANEPNVVWFDSYNDAINFTNPLPTYQPLVDNKTYYGVLVGPANCPSLPLPVTVKISLGLNDLDLASLRYYPNPVDSELNISYKEAIQSVEVYDLLGKQIKTQKFDANDVKIDISNLSAGTYMIKVHTNTGSQFIKIIKK